MSIEQMDTEFGKLSVAARKYTPVNNSPPPEPRSNLPTIITPTKADTTPAHEHPLSGTSSAKHRRRSLFQPLIQTTTSPLESRQRSTSIQSVGSQTSVHARNVSTSSSVQDEQEEVAELLRRLASKEYEVLQLNEKMKELKRALMETERELNSHERELAVIRDAVSKNLYKVADSSYVDSPSKPDPSTSVQSPQSQSTPRKTIPRSDSVWNKGVSLFNQFDQILQNEFEKTSKESGLWGFVSDVKNGILGDDPIQEEEEKEMQMWV